MHNQIDIAGHTLDVELTRAAGKALDKQEKSIFAEMELYFSCLIRKKVRFYDSVQNGDVVYLNDKLGISFRPVMTKTCGTDYEGDEPPLTDFPIHKAENFMPKWLKIDYCHGEWQGEFGFVS